MRTWTIGFAALALVGLATLPAHADNIVVNGGFGPHSGTAYAALGATKKLGSVSQTLVTAPGQAYTLDFFLASDGFTPNHFRVDWNGSTVFKQNNIPRQDYVEITLPVTATGASTTLTFFDRNDPGFLSLDDVSVTPGTNGIASAPEPGSISLLLLGAVGLGGYARWRQRRA